MQGQPSAAPSADTRRRHLNLAPSPQSGPPASLHRLEAEAIHDTGLALQQIADRLPEHSELREDLQVTAESYLAWARFRGIDTTAPTPVPRLRLV